jgi:hypothetical protein
MLHRRQRGYEKAKRRTMEANQIRELNAEADKLNRELREFIETPRREQLRAKALRDIKGWTGEYKTPGKHKRK